LSIPSLLLDGVAGGGAAFFFAGLFAGCFAIVISP
jgi:hypothetical protein